ncbi:MAG: hypothetical protein QNK43_11475 [Amphritea sp.]|nr:hypothetical protein [Amphritea sp.]
MTKKLPLLIGITGHRDAVVCDEQGGHAPPEKLIEKIKDALEKWRKEVGEDTPIWLLTGMAKGPDLLAIQAIESLMEEKSEWSSLNTDVIPVLPMPAEHFIKDFAPDDKQSQICYEFYLKKYQHNLIVVTPELSDEECHFAYHDMEYGTLRNTLYLNQGAFLSRYCNVLLAAWDGCDSSSKGGTADVVKMKCGLTPALQSRLHPSLRSISRFDGQNGGVVHHIYVDRQRQHDGELITANFQQWQSGKTETATSIYICHGGKPSAPVPLSQSLRQEFSALIEQIRHFNSRRAPAPPKIDNVITKGLGRAAGIFAEADLAAITAQKRYRRQLICFIGVAFFALMAYELVSNLLNTFVGTALTFAILALVTLAAVLIHWSKKARYKWHYQLNRMVAEALRLRCFLNLGGVRPSHKPIMPRRYRATFPIVTQAIHTGELIWWQKNISLNVDEIRKYWIDDQINYLQHKLIANTSVLKKSFSWLHAHPKMAMKRLSGYSKLILGLAITIGVGMFLMQLSMLIIYPDTSLWDISSRCTMISSTSNLMVQYWCQWNFLFMLVVQLLVMLGGIIALWLELANYQAVTAGFENMLDLYQDVQTLLIEDLLPDEEMKILLSDLAREAMQEHIEWNSSELESDLAKR